MDPSTVGSQPPVRAATCRTTKGIGDRRNGPGACGPESGVPLATVWSLGQFGTVGVAQLRTAAENSRHGVLAPTETILGGCDV
jgi:hypothetical protein